MFKFEKGRRLLRRFQKNEDGNVAILFAISAVAVIGCMGAAMDYSTLSNAKSRSQSMADQMALAAAIYVKDYGQEPSPVVGPDGLVGENPSSDTGYLDKRHKSYTASELGYEFKGFVEGGSENVTVEFEYDDTNKEVRTKVAGATKPTFIQILGKQDTSFSSQATAKYEDKDLYDPATVIMVLDNSGSMSFDDKPLVYEHGDLVDQDDAQQRIEALKSSATSFMDDLQVLVGDQSNNSDKVLRTGMLAYNENIITARQVVPNWGTDAVKGSVGSMTATGGTNSAPPLDTARIWMSTEDENHKAIHGDDPLKFLIFMTDGVNSEDYGLTWVAEEDTGQWKGYTQECRSYRRRGTYCWYEEDTVESEDEPTEGYDWEEGKWALTADLYSDEDCESMKEDGVRIYSIGFGLEAGEYNTNRYWGDDRTYTIEEELRTQAYTLLSSCASEPSTFLTAENTEELEAAFERIGSDIQTEIIRLSN